MPRWGEWITMPNGSVAHVLHSGPRPKNRPCGCGAPSTLQCDYPMQTGRTCDKYLCRGCAVRKAPNIDWCREHRQEAMSV